jgi:hypothetical protein
MDTSVTRGKSSRLVRSALQALRHETLDTENESHPDVSTLLLHQDCGIDCPETVRRHLTLCTICLESLIEAQTRRETREASSHAAPKVWWQAADLGRRGGTRSRLRLRLASYWSRSEDLTRLWNDAPRWTSSLSLAVATLALFVSMGQVFFAGGQRLAARFADREVLTGVRKPEFQVSDVDRVQESAKSYPIRAQEFAARDLMDSLGRLTRDRPNLLDPERDELRRRNEDFEDLRRQLALARRQERLRSEQLRRLRVLLDKDRQEAAIGVPSVRSDVNGAVTKRSSDSIVGEARPVILDSVKVEPGRGVSLGVVDDGTLSVRPISDPVASDVRKAVDNSGRVGIGTFSPSAKFHVLGDVTVDGNIGAKYQDVAEWVDTPTSLEDGTVVILDPARENQVVASSRSYDTGVAGVVSRQSGLVLGELGPSKALIAQSGRVRIKVDATLGGIAIGDLLVTSPTPGYAMRSVAVDWRDGATLHRPGTIVGKALQALPTGRGEILALLTLQ